MTLAAEYLLATGLAAEIVMRLMLTRQRPWQFYPLVALDTVAVLTVVPSLAIVTLARVIRLCVSGVRMLHLIDKLSRERGNPYLILLVYPLVVPVVAALFFAIERNAPQSQIHDYFGALVMMMSYSLTLGLAAHHPVTYGGKAIAGAMLLVGLMCVAIIGNALTARYTRVRIDPTSGDHVEFPNA